MNKTMTILYFILNSSIIFYFLFFLLVYTMCPTQTLVFVPCAATPSSPRCWTSWVSTCPTNCPVRNLLSSSSYYQSLSQFPFGGFFFPVVILLRLPCRPANSRRELVHPRSQEGGGAGRSDGCRRRSGGATAQPTERLSTAASGHCGFSLQTSKPLPFFRFCFVKVAPLDHGLFSKKKQPKKTCFCLRCSHLLLVSSI